MRTNMVDDTLALMPNVDPEDLQDIKETAELLLKRVTRKLRNADPNIDPFTWWPQQQAEFGSLFPMVKMMFAIPATSADNERSFSSASYTLDSHRYKMDIDTFRKEHRIRRHLTGSEGHDQAGRQDKVNRMSSLLNIFHEVAQGH